MAGGRPGPRSLTWTSTTSGQRVTSMSTMTCPSWDRPCRSALASRFSMTCATRRRQARTSVGGPCARRTSSPRVRATAICPRRTSTTSKAVMATGASGRSSVTSARTDASESASPSSSVVTSSGRRGPARRPWVAASAASRALHSSCRRLASYAPTPTSAPSKSMLPVPSRVVRPDHGHTLDPTSVGVAGRRIGCRSRRPASSPPRTAITECDPPPWLTLQQIRTVTMAPRIPPRLMRTSRAPGPASPGPPTPPTSEVRTVASVARPVSPA